MSAPEKSGMVGSAVIGLVFAVVSTGALYLGWFLAPVSAVLGVAAAVCAAAGILGRASRRPLGLLVLVLSGIAFAFAFLAALHGSLWVLFLIIAAVAYLAGATVYGFAGQAQGVRVGARTGLLVLLLLAVIPLLNMLGLIGVLIAAIARRPPIAVTA
jgi:hypothetical protein